MLSYTYLNLNGRMVRSWNSKTRPEPNPIASTSTRFLYFVFFLCKRGKEYLLAKLEKQWGGCFFWIWEKGQASKVRRRRGNVNVGRLVTLLRVAKPLIPTTIMTTSPHKVRFPWETEQSPTTIFLSLFFKLLQDKNLTLFSFPWEFVWLWFGSCVSLKNRVFFFFFFWVCFGPKLRRKKLGGLHHYGRVGSINWVSYS
jgi:hypothetical protein